MGGQLPNGHTGNDPANLVNLNELPNVITKGRKQRELERFAVTTIILLLLLRGLREAIPGEVIKG